MAKNNDDPNKVHITYNLYVDGKFYYLPVCSTT